MTWNSLMTYKLIYTEHLLIQFQIFCTLFVNVLEWILSSRNNNNNLLILKSMSIGCVTKEKVHNHLLIQSQFITLNAVLTLNYSWMIPLKYGRCECELHCFTSLNFCCRYIFALYRHPLKATVDTFDVLSISDYICEAFADCILIKR